jgi:cob(I)alamin adenosyltransferase
VAELPFDDPRVALNRIYTKRGDTGETGLAGGQRVPKDSPRIEAYGTVDELNAVVGMAYTSAEQNIGQDLRVGLLLAILRRVQHELFNLGSMLATLPAGPSTRSRLESRPSKLPNSKKRSTR